MIFKAIYNFFFFFSDKSGSTCKPTWLFLLGSTNNFGWIFLKMCINIWFELNFSVEIVIAFIPLRQDWVSTTKSSAKPKWSYNNIYNAEIPYNVHFQMRIIIKKCSERANERKNKRAWRKKSVGRSVNYNIDRFHVTSLNSKTQS